MNEDRLALIEKYVGKEMADAEKLRFEEQMAVDAELCADVKIVVALHEVVLGVENNEENGSALTQSLRQLGADFFLKDEPVKNAGSPGITPVKKITGWKTYLSAAAIIALIILSAVWLTGDNEQPRFADSEKKDTVQEGRQERDTASREKATVAEGTLQNEIKAPDIEVLYAQYFTRDAIPSETIEELDRGLRYYSDGNYRAARTFFEVAKADGDSRSDDSDMQLQLFYIDYYTAQCFMSEGKMDEAITDFSSALTRSPHDSLTMKTQWYLALAYLKNNDKKSAAVLLQRLNNKSTPAQYKLRADNLLTELEK